MLKARLTRLAIAAALAAGVLTSGVFKAGLIGPP